MKRFYGLISVFLLWYVLSFVFQPLIPFPHDVVMNFMKLFPHRLHLDIIYSVKRLLIGMIIAIILGVHIGLWLGLKKKADQMVSPFIYAIYPIPKAALVPVLIILLGIGDLSKIVLIILIVIFPVIVNIKDAIRSIPNEIFYVSKSLSLNRMQMYKEIVIPAIFPHLLTSVRIGIGTSVAVLYLSESVSSRYGLGYYISISTNNLNIFTGIFALSVIGYLLFALVDTLEKRLCKWV